MIQWLSLQVKNPENRAVSPVIGVILMVAITVILAAVIGAFVLEIGDQQETAPSTSFTSNERTVYAETPGPAKGNLTQKILTINGGETVPIKNIRIKVDDNPGAVGINSFADDSFLADSNKYLPTTTQPNFGRTLGSNDAVKVGAGESWNIIAWGDRDPVMITRSRIVGEDDGGKIHWNMAHSLENWYAANPPGPCILGRAVADYDDHKDPWEFMEEEADRSEAPGNCRGNQRETYLLEEGQNINIVWRANSGGKTQTLFKTVVQQPLPDY